ncbi:unnamed protein product [Paramecium octaurelia]|uniref:Protein kinase domain-containing protein n=1 Tax=Paramecium octaurelia TaxID=43137 RepID=A0A8S1VEA0_PAROT|nr:unnamed protein product [Paramecium octaurelia]
MEQSIKDSTIAMNKARVIGNYICNNKNQLGVGLMCTVYEAKHLETNNYVALKQISKKAIKEKKLTAERLKESYDLEIKILQKCKKSNNKNVISLLDHFETSEHYNIVLELCDQNLKEYIEQKENKRLTEEEAVDILIQIVEGQKCLHEINYCHRDIKPENILVKGGVIKITDVNLAKYIENMLTKTCSFVGTQFYIAPEVDKKQYYSPYKADIYSLGVVFYEMLYGLLSKQEKNVNFKEKIERSTLQISDILKQLILKMIQEDPNDRADWSWVSSCIYQYLINKSTNSHSIQVISSFYFNAWQEKYQFLKQIIEDLCLLQIKNENIFLYQSGLLIIKLIIQLVEEKVVELQNATKISDAEFYKSELKLLSIYRYEYLRVVQNWYQQQMDEKKKLLCNSEHLKDEFKYIERSKQFDRHFQRYLVEFCNQLNDLEYKEDRLKLQKKLLQLKLIVACDQKNDFELVQTLLSSRLQSQGNYILSFVQHLQDLRIVEEYMRELQPVIDQILNEG